MSEKIYTRDERKNLSFPPYAYGSMAIDWSACPLAQRYAPWLAAPQGLPLHKRAIAGLAQQERHKGLLVAPL